MHTLIDPRDVALRAREGLDRLLPAERLVYLLQDFEVLMDMEGWDHFFFYEHHFAHYAELKEWLHTVGEDESLTVLHDFEAFVAAQGLPLTPDGIGDLLQLTNPEEPDWRELYMARTSERWDRVIAWLGRHGYAIAGM